MRASIGPKSYSSVASYSLALPLAATVQAQTRTNILYVDRNSLRVGYQVRSALGESRISRTELVVQLRLSFGDVTPDYVVGCTLPSQTNGVGECASELPSTYFGSAGAADVQVSVRYSSGTTFVSSAGSITLQARVVQSSLSAAGMVAVMPESPRFPGDQFAVTIYAHTGQPNFALRGWSVFLQYDVTVLTLVSQQFSSVYQAPTYTSVAGAFDVVATGVSASQTDLDVTGQTSLYLMTLVFRIVSGAVATSSSVFSGVVGEFVNQGTQTYLSDQVISVTDSRGGLQAEGTLAVEFISNIGLFAYSATTSLVNTAVFDAQIVVSSVVVLQLYNRAATPTSQTTNYNCVSSSPVALVVQASCHVSLTAAQTSGGRVNANVLSSTGLILASVPFVIHYPSSVTLTVEDDELGLVAGIGVTGSCDTSATRYQQTVATATAAFASDVINADVTRLVGFSTNDSSVVVSSGSVVRGVGVGRASVRASVAAATLSTVSASVRVTAGVVTVTHLRATVVTGVAWIPHSLGVIPWTPNINFTATAQFVQVLDS